MGFQEARQESLRSQVLEKAINLVVCCWTHIGTYFFINRLLSSQRNASENFNLNGENDLKDDESSQASPNQQNPTHASADELFKSVECSCPDRPFHNFRASKSADRRFRTTQSSSIDEFKKLWKGGRGVLQKLKVNYKFKKIYETPSSDKYFLLL